MIERRFVPSEGDVGLIRGLAAAWGRVPAFREELVPGAFAASIRAHEARGTLPVMLWSHDPAEVIGRWSSMVETDRGLVVEGQLALGVQRGRETRELVMAGAVRGLSIGFRPVRTEPAPNGWRRLIELQLLEISVVAIPANPGAAISEGRADPGSFITACRSAARSITTRN